MLLFLNLKNINLSQNLHYLSIGEIQKLLIIKKLIPNLIDVIYIFDTPIYGLDLEDIKKLILLLKKQVKKQNSVIIIVNHINFIKKAQYIIDFPPDFKTKNIFFQGTLKKFLSQKYTQNIYLKKYYIKQNIICKNIDNEKYTLIIKNIHYPKYKNISLYIPLNKITYITGNSSVGKSLLINDIIIPNIKYQDLCDKVYGLDNIYGYVLVKQNINKMNYNYDVCNYLGLDKEIIQFFTLISDNKKLGYAYNDFYLYFKNKFYKEKNIESSLNNTYNVCVNNKYNQQHYMYDILNIRYKNKNLINILNMTISKIYTFLNFLSNKFKHLIILLLKLGLSDIKLNQNVSSLSIGEQRKIIMVKKISSKYSLKNILYIFDESTINMHMIDIDYMIHLIKYLIYKQNTVIISSSYDVRIANSVNNIIKLMKNSNNNIKILNCIN